MFQEIIVTRSQPNLHKLLSQQPISPQHMASLLRTPDPNRDHATPFLLACLSGSLATCTYLVQLGADVNAKSLR